MNNNSNSSNKASIDVAKRFFHAVYSYGSELALTEPIVQDIRHKSTEGSNDSNSCFRVVQVTAMSDNYVYLIEANDVDADDSSGSGSGSGGNTRRFVVDPSESGPVLEAIRQLHWPSVDGILITHHHHRHF